MDLAWSRSSQEVHDVAGGVGISQNLSYFERDANKFQCYPLKRRDGVCRLGFHQV